MNNKVLWIDLTMLVHWQGQLTGIQRVEYNLARRFAQKPYARFCVFDKKTRSFLAYDFQLVEAKIAGLQSSVDSPIQQADSASRIKGKVAARLPAKLKRPIIAGLRLTKNVRLMPVPQKTIGFNSSDKLLILSGDWSDDIFAATLKGIKQKSNLSVTQIVYDLLPAVQPAFFVPGMPQQVSGYMATIFPLCDEILAISDATRQDIERFQDIHDLPKRPVRVFRLGDDFSNSEPQKPGLPIKPGDFLLCVGTVEARKNHVALYYVVQEALSRGIALPPIVIAGKIGWLVSDFIYLVQNDPVINKRILFLNNGTDREVAWLFKNCKFSLYPSFYEGWGLPIAESLFYDKLCLASDSSSMPEIAGELIDYFSPNDPRRILELIVKYLDKPKLLRAKEERIRRQYKPTGWDDTFKQVEEYLS